jgi:hypothetical protein
MEPEPCLHKERIGDSELWIDLAQGAKIVLLRLEKVKVIDGGRPGGFTASGSYLMYPWVNRLEEYHKAENKDGAGLPLHGLYCQARRVLIERRETEHEIVLMVEPEVIDKEYPAFVEMFVLTRNSLKVAF